MNNSNPLYSIFPQYTHHELDQIYREFSYDADAASEQITKGALDWNKNDPQKLKKKPQRRWTPKPKREYKDNKSGSSPIVSPTQPTPTPAKIEKQDSAIEQPSMSFVLQHGKDKMEMVQADLSNLDLSQYVVLIPKVVYEKKEKEIFDRQFTSILPTKPVSSSASPSKSVATTQTFGQSSSSPAPSQRLHSAAKPLFNSVPVQDKLRLLGIDEESKKSTSAVVQPRANKDLKDFVLNMGIGLNEPTSPTTPPNTPISAKPKKTYKKRYYNSGSASVDANK